MWKHKTLVRNPYVMLRSGDIPRLTIFISSNNKITQQFRLLLQRVTKNPVYNVTMVS